MTYLRSILTLLLLVLPLSPAGAQDTANPIFRFEIRPEVTIKLRNSSNNRPVRGNLVSLSRTEVIVDTPKATGQRVPYERIDSLKTAGGTLEFSGDEDFSAVADRVRKSFSGLVESSDTDPTPRLTTGSNAASLPGSEANMQAKNITPNVPPRPGLGQAGFGGIGNLPKNRPVPGGNDGDGGASENTNPALPGSEAANTNANSGVMEVSTCSKCGKDLTTADLKSGACPHCKTEFAVALPVSATNPSNPFDSAANSAAKGPFAANATGGGPIAPPPVAPPPVAQGGQVVVGGGGFTFDSIPNWAKGGLFVLLVLVGYHVMFNR